MLNKKQIAITLGIICLLLTMAIFIQIKTVNGANLIAARSLTDNDLRDQVLIWKERYDSVYEELEEANKKLEKIRQTATEDTEGASEKEEELKKNNMLIGMTDVKGEGVTVTLKDNNTVTADTIGIADDISLYLVHDTDIRAIVNELENAGAEAISINDQRVVITTSITCEGNVINVNGEKVSSPFVIKAIGSSLSLYSALTRPGGYVETLNSTGIPTTVKRSDAIAIGKFNGVINFKYGEIIK